MEKWHFSKIFSIIFHILNNFIANFWKITPNFRAVLNNKISSGSIKKIQNILHSKIVTWVILDFIESTYKPFHWDCFSLQHLIRFLDQSIQLNNSMGGARILVWGKTLLGVGLVGVRRIFENFKKFLKKITKRHYFSIFFKIFNKQCVNFSRVWRKNTNCLEILRKFSMKNQEEN